MRHFDIRRKLRKAGATMTPNGVLNLKLWDRKDSEKVMVDAVLAETNPDGDILGYSLYYFNVDEISVGRDNDGREYISVYVTNRINGSWADLEGDELTLANWESIFAQLL